jgi:hypothetical protein
MLTQGPAEKATDDFLNDFSWGRLVTEAGLAIGGSILTGGLALPGLAIRSGMLARPFLSTISKKLNWFRSWCRNRCSCISNIRS